MRSFPRMLIAAPGDPLEVRACMRYLVANPQPSYLRLGKSGEAVIHSDIPELAPGKWALIRGNNTDRKILLSTGAALPLALDWQAQPDYRDFAVFSLPLWGMLAKNIQPKQISNYDQVVTLEDHLIDGGFGSWLLEAASGNPGCLAKITVKALSPMVCGLVASQAKLNQIGGITPDCMHTS